MSFPDTGGFEPLSSSLGSPDTGALDAEETQDFASLLLDGFTGHWGL